MLVERRRRKSLRGKSRGSISASKKYASAEYFKNTITNTATIKAHDLSISDRKSTPFDSLPTHNFIFK